MHIHIHRSSDTFLANLPAFKYSKSTFCNLTQLFSWSDRNSCNNHFIILAQALQQVWYVCYNTVADKGMDDPNGVWKFFPTQLYAMSVIPQTQDQGTQVTKLAATITTLMASCIVNFTAATIHRSVGTSGQSNLTKSASRGPIPRLGVTPGGRKLYHWIPGVGFPISVP